MAGIKRFAAQTAMLAFFAGAPVFAQAPSVPYPDPLRAPSRTSTTTSSTTGTSSKTTGAAASAGRRRTGPPRSPPKKRTLPRGRHLADHPPPDRKRAERRRRRRRPTRSRARARRTLDAGVADAGVAPDAGSIPDAGVALAPPVAPALTPEIQVERVWEGLGESVSIFVPTARLRSLTEPLLLLLLIGLSLLISGGAGHLRPYFARDGLLPRLLNTLFMAGRFVAFTLTILLLVRAAPSWLRPALPWVLLAAAGAVGWSARDILPDLIAGGVLLYERRVRRGVWLNGEGFAGTVERLGFRATWLTDELDRRVSIPNRRLLAQPVVVASGARVWHQTRLRLPSTADGDVRRALAHAATTSVWVALGTPAELHQDVDDAAVWHVRVQLRRRQDHGRFDGELQNRTLAMLAAQPRSPPGSVEGTQ